jgi:hypothetical protein
MEINLIRFNSEIIDFMCDETLRQIDYGILDLSNVADYELKNVLCYYGELLEVELRLNYMNSNTGIFRVHKFENKYCYEEFGDVIEAGSIDELMELVLNDSRIWYVFDDIKARELGD